VFTTALHTLRHSITRTTWAALAVTTAFTTVPAVAQAQEFVSIRGNTVNIRTQPNTRSAVQWELANGYPLQVTGRQGNWLKVRDYESALGWVHRPLTNQQAHHVVKARTANLRQGPGTQHRVVGKLEQHEIVRTLEKRPGWAKVRRTGGEQGWVARNLLWGW